MPNLLTEHVCLKREGNFPKKVSKITQCHLVNLNTNLSFALAKKKSRGCGSFPANCGRNLRYLDEKKVMLDIGNFSFGYFKLFIRLW